MSDVRLQKLSDYTLNRMSTPRQAIKHYMERNKVQYCNIALTKVYAAFEKLWKNDIVAFKGFAT